MCRVVVVGANGAGKTWFAERLAARTGAPVICKDALALTTGWRQRPRSEVLPDLTQAVAAERWVLEGGPSILAPAILGRASLVIWLDLPARVRAWQIMKRSVTYLGRTRPEHPPGNPDWPGLRQVRFLWRAVADHHRFVRAIQEALTGWDGFVIRLSDRAAVDRFLAGMSTDADRAKAQR